eukprot:GEMP01010158.1.p1 GENE.GEMP01010158.1~~GEMP01010158.1.p1  ORF type:complete len:743 (+),score=218.44 GEMP01010158.1:287-2515(+)
MTSPLTITAHPHHGQRMSANVDDFNVCPKVHEKMMTSETRPSESETAVTVVLDNGNEVHLDRTRDRVTNVGELRASIAAMNQLFSPNVTLLSAGNESLDDDDPVPVYTLASFTESSEILRDDSFYAHAISAHVSIGDTLGISDILGEISACDVPTFAGAALLHAVENITPPDISSPKSRKSSATKCDSVTGSLAAGPSLVPDILREASAYQVMEVLLDNRADVTMSNMEGETALMVCARRGIDKAISRLLMFKSDIMSTDEYGSTALHLACAAGHMHCVHILLDARVDIHARNSEGSTALHQCAIYDSVKCAIILLDRRAAIDPRDGAGKSSLMHALCEGNSNIANMLLDSKAYCTKMLSKEGDSAIAAACRSTNDDVELVARLLKARCDPRSINPISEDSVLHEAARAGNIRIATLLLDKGSVAHNASVNAEGATPLNLVCAHGHSAMVSLLVNKRAEVNTILYTARITSTRNETARNKETVLLVAAREGHADVVSELLRAKADIHMTNADGECPLSLACASGNVEAASLLVSGGADATHVDRGGCTPLHAACVSGAYDIAALLIHAHAEVMARDNHERTCLHEVSVNGNSAIAKLLLTHRADAEAKDDRNLTAIHEACSEGHVTLTQLLLESMVPLNGKDIDGELPLHKAARNNFEKICNILLGATANVNAANNDGETALHEAARHGHLDACRVLVHHGADVHAKTNEAESPLDWAQSKEYGELVTVMESAGGDSTCMLM